MKIKIKENVVFESFHNKKELMEKILTMIIADKTDHIVYKGNPNDINYKLMKKVMLKDYTKRIDPDLVKNMYKEVVEKNKNKQFCLIYKEK